MSLDTYKNKRDLKRSNEPDTSYHSSDEKQLRFVVHKHDASHLHFDFRLELDGVLKSWAVPKGISLDPTQKKLAILVEDHPFEYRNFEGVIPAGNYGAGTVMIWDEGWYTLPGIDNKNRIQEEMNNELSKGHSVIVLHGLKLRGAFQLVRLKNQQQSNNWLLFKKQDEYSSADTILDQRSVRSARTMDEIRSGVSDVTANNNDISNTQLNPESIPQPTYLVHPMLAQLVDAPFDRKGWIFEIKWDGYRAIANISKQSVQLYSRNGKRLNKDFPLVEKDLHNIGFEGILDGEIVVIDKSGKADFGALQNYSRTQKGTIRYYVFDLIYLNGEDLHNVPLLKRKELLKKHLPPLPTVSFNDHIEEFGNDFFKIIKENNLEGMVAKDGNSPYIEGKRTRFWLKIKTHLEQDFVIGGFTEPKGGRTGFGALLVGIYKNNQLEYTGSVGGGFDEKELQMVLQRLMPLLTTSSPFEITPQLNSKISWIQPQLVCQVKFSEWTSDGLLRQPVFMHFRDDVDPHSVQREEIEPSSEHHFHLADTPSKDITITINGKSLRLTNLNKVFWPNEKITKGALIDYYQQIAPVILPHLIDRPQSLNRFPNGITGPHFFQKDVKDAPDWIQTILTNSESQQKAIKYLLCQDEGSLIYIINLGAIELNVWNSKVTSMDEPDYVVIDIDPLNCSFNNVIKTALSIHSICKEIRLPHYVKTSGATGLHIYIPLKPGYSFSQARQFSEIICRITHKLLPDITSIERVPSRRNGKVYLDFLQNALGKTMAAPYCVRPRPHATVSTPLNWEELNDGITPDQFTINTIQPRIEHYGDLWRHLGNVGIDMETYLSRLKDLYSNI
jgi:bifunctional non-homologous end joining protein LigD